MDTTRILFALKQGPRSLENHVREFLAIAHYSDLPDIILIEISCDGIKQPLKSKLRREGPRSSLAHFLDYALLTVGSLFTVGFAEGERDTASVTEMADAPECTHKMVNATMHRNFSADLREPSKVTVDLHESNQVTVDVKEPGQVPADVKEPGQVPADVKEPGQVPADVKEPGQVPADVKEPGQVPADVKEPGQVPADVKEPGQAKPQLIVTGQAKPQVIFVSQAKPQSLFTSQLFSQSLFTSPPKCQSLSHPEI